MKNIAAGIDDDMFVVAANNLLFFSFQEFVDFAMSKGNSCILCHEQPSIEKVQRKKDFDFEAHKQLVPMQPRDVPTTYADATALERDYGFTPKVPLRKCLRHFAERHKRSCR